MHDQVLDSAAGAPACPACAETSGGRPGAARPAHGEEMRVALPAVAEIGTLEEARAAIDGVDAALAVLLEHRAALAAVVQCLKPVGGFAGRDPERERRIVEAMAGLAPTLGPDRLAPIVNAIIEAGLDAAENARP
ncbi:chorismate mutase [Actinomadura roseirufa]|uniref:chorismate mutase n=1 Tax=Actinomadura roseirufa TaxID=2094049 RepID=UPI0027956A57|nr:chorismate mutase [Actinomadura roseirufa]